MVTLSSHARLGASWRASTPQRQMRRWCPGRSSRVLNLLAEKLPELERLCRLHGVKRLEVVGSAARELDFDPTRSDVDFLVEFEPGRLPASLGEFFGFREALEQTVGRAVDLVMLDAVRNPYVRESLERNRRLLYAA